MSVNQFYVYLFKYNLLYITIYLFKIYNIKFTILKLKIKTKNLELGTMKFLERIRFFSKLLKIGLLASM